MRIDGPHDTFGRVLKTQPSGYSLIRGLGKKAPAAHNLITKVLICKSK